MPFLLNRIDSIVHWHYASMEMDALPVYFLVRAFSQVALHRRRPPSFSPTFLLLHYQTPPAGMQPEEPSQPLSVPQQRYVLVLWLSSAHLGLRRFVFVRIVEAKGE